MSTGDCGQTLGTGCLRGIFTEGFRPDHADRAFILKDLDLHRQVRCNRRASPKSFCLWLCGPVPVHGWPTPVGAPTNIPPNLDSSSSLPTSFQNTTTPVRLCANGTEASGGRRSIS